jgi:DNA-binding transcriptional MerR regulator
LAQVEGISVGIRNHRRFTQDDIKLITKIDEYQKQGFILKVAAEKAREK